MSDETENAKETAPEALLTLGHLLHRNRAVKIGEIVSVFAVAIGVILIGYRISGENPLALMAIVWVANIAMLVLVWLGLYLRGQTFAHFGLPISRITPKNVLSALWKSVATLVFGAVAFAVGSVVAGMIAGVPQQADLSEYNYLQGNLPMLLLSLAGVYIVSSFGEEVIYRGFLITRLAELGSAGKRSLWIAVFVSAIIFGLIHYTWGPAGMVQTGFLGLALGTTYVLFNRNLWINVLAHVYLDTLLLVPLYLGAEQS